MTGKNLRYAALYLILLVGMILWICIPKGNPTTFDGSCVCNASLYLLDFKTLNRQDNQTMTLQAGDTLHCSWHIDRGTVDILITNEGGGTLYRGNRIDEAEFELTVQTDGRYTIQVTGKDAGGRIEIIRSSNSEAQ